ncbi:MAG: hypothetical protein M0031_03965 [Thermaerobacter sp.]|nr:hypothetical protein [Thermaerobacter sp.]
MSECKYDGQTDAGTVYDSLELTDGIQSRFVQDRLQETEWQDRGYIADLKEVEHYLQSERPGFAGSLHMRSLRNYYPVEVDCIRKELEEGIYTSPEEFRRLKAEQETTERQVTDDIERQKTDKEEETRRKWREKGGRP